MTRCTEFYQKCEREGPDWCDKCPRTVERISNYLDLRTEFRQRGIEERPIGRLPEWAARPLFEKRNQRLKDRAIEIITQSLKTDEKRWTITDVKNLFTQLRRSEKTNIITSTFDQKVIQCEISEANKFVTKASVDLILTDPPYTEALLPVWEDLGRFANFALKNGGLLIAYSGQSHLPTILNTLSNHLNYVWCCALLHKGSLASMYSLHFKVGWKPLVMFSNGQYQAKEGWFTDAIQGGGRSKDLHDWQQCVGDLEHILVYFTSEGSLVVDPFCGSGTTLVACKNLKRSFLGMDNDPEIVKVARGRLISE